MRYYYDEVFIYYFHFTNLEYIWKWNISFYLISSLKLYLIIGNSFVVYMCTVAEIGRTSLGTLLPPRPQCRFLAMLKSTSLGKKMAPRNNVIASMTLDFMILSPCCRQMLLPGRGPPLVEVPTTQITIALVDILLP